MGTRALRSLLLLAAVACADDPISPPPPIDAAVVSVLQRRPAATSLPDLYSMYGGRADFVPGPALTESQSRTLLVDHARRDPRVDAQRALDLFDHPRLRAAVPAPGLRAMYASLVGLPFGERAVHFLLHARTPSGLPKVALIDYGPVGEELLAEVVSVSSAGQMTVHFRDDLHAENPLLFAGLGVHELLHQDAGAYRYEELVAHTIQTLVTLAQMEHRPDLFRERTPLTQGALAWSLALYNGGLGHRLGILRSNDDATLYPGAPPWAGFRAFAVSFGRHYATDTPGNTLLQELTDELSQIGRAASCRAHSFSEAYVACFDRLIGDVSIAADGPGNPWSAERRVGVMAEVLGVREHLLAGSGAVP